MFRDGAHPRVPMIQMYRRPVFFVMSFRRLFQIGEVALLAIRRMPILPKDDQRRCEEPSEYLPLSSSVFLRCEMPFVLTTHPRISPWCFLTRTSHFHRYRPSRHFASSCALRYAIRHMFYSSGNKKSYFKICPNWDSSFKIHILLFPKSPHFTEMRIKTHS